MISVTVVFVIVWEWKRQKKEIRIYILRVTIDFVLDSKSFLKNFHALAHVLVADDDDGGGGVHYQLIQLVQIRKLIRPHRFDLLK